EETPPATGNPTFAPASVPWGDDVVTAEGLSCARICTSAASFVPPNGFGSRRASANESAPDSLSHGTPVERPSPELFNSNLGSVPNFVNSSCVPRGGTDRPCGHCGAAICSRCESDVLVRNPYMVTLRGIGLVFTLVLLITFSSSAPQIFVAH